MIIVIQLNGKLKGSITVPAGFGKDEILTAAKADEKIAGIMAGKNIVKEIYVPGKLINFVVQG